MGDSEGITDEKEKAASAQDPDQVSGQDGAPPESVPFQSAPSNIPPIDGRPPVRRSSIRPAPPSFKPTTRDTARLPPPMVVHSGDADESAPAWGAPEVVNHPSQVNVGKLARREPFALAEDLNLSGAANSHEETLPFEFPPDGGVPREAQAFAARAEQLAAEPTSPASENPTFHDSTSLEIPPPPDSSESVTLSKNELPQESSPTSGQVGRERASVAAAQQLFAEPIRLPVTATPSAHKKRILPVVLAVGILGLCGVVLAGAWRKTPLAAREDLSASAQVSAQVAPQPPTLPEAKAPEAKAPEAKAPEAKAPEAKAPEVHVGASPSAVAVATPPPAVKTVRVRLVMNPPDSKLARNGAIVPGPPYEFDIPRGVRLSFEASHKGYVTRKVTLDATKTLYQVGLVYDTKKRK